LHKRTPEQIISETKLGDYLEMTEIPTLSDNEAGVVKIRSFLIDTTAIQIWKESTFPLTVKSHRKRESKKTTATLLNS
jgi:hypothetical protein